MFMSFPALNHVEVRLEQIAGGTRVSLRHRGIGFYNPDLKQGLGTGWQHILEHIQKDFA